MVWLVGIFKVFPCPTFFLAGRVFARHKQKIEIRLATHCVLIKHFHSFNVLTVVTVASTVLAKSFVNVGSLSFRQ